MSASCAVCGTPGLAIIRGHREDGTLVRYGDRGPICSGSRLPAESSTAEGQLMSLWRAIATALSQASAEEGLDGATLHRFYELLDEAWLRIETARMRADESG